LSSKRTGERDANTPGLMKKGWALGKSQKKKPGKKKKKSKSSQRIPPNKPEESGRRARNQIFKNHTVTSVVSGVVPYEKGGGQRKDVL